MDVMHIRIEKNKNNQELVRRLYDQDKVLFDECILKSEKLLYTISYIPRLDTYDVIITDIKGNHLIRYESRQKLSGSTLKYFNHYKDDEVSDNFGNHFRCITHFIEYLE